MTDRKRAFVKKYLIITGIAAAVIAAAILLRWRASTYLENADDRVTYLASLGWTCDASSEQYREITLPDTFGGVMEEYNQMQIRNGFDMSRYAGKICQQYIYTLTEHPGSLTAYAVIYIYDGHVIGGDIHTAAIDGYMHGLCETR